MEISENRIRKLRFRILFSGSLLLWLAACTATGPTDIAITLVVPPTRTPAQPTRAQSPAESTLAATLLAAPTVPPNLWIDTELLVVSPEQPRAGDSLEISFAVHNDGSEPVENALVIASIVPAASSGGSTIDEYNSVELPAGDVTAVRVILGEMVEGDYILAIAVNRTIRAIIDNRVFWNPADPREWDDSDNIVETEVQVLPFESYTSEACPAGFNLAISAEDVSLAAPELPAGFPSPTGGLPLLLRVTVQNTGSIALYRVPVRFIVLGGGSLVRHTTALPPCGGTSDLVMTWQPDWQSLRVVINPTDAPRAAPEDDYTDNEVTVNLSELATPSP